MTLLRVQWIVSACIQASYHWLWGCQGSNGPTILKRQINELEYWKKKLHCQWFLPCRVNPCKGTPNSLRYGDQRSHEMLWGALSSWWNHRNRHGRPSGLWLRNKTWGRQNSMHQQCKKFFLRQTVVLSAILIMDECRKNTSSSSFKDI